DSFSCGWWSWRGCASEAGLRARPAEQARAQLGVRGRGAEPDRKERPGEVIAADRSLHLAVERVLDADSGDAKERHPLSRFDARHPAVELGNAALQPGQHPGCALLEALLPGVAQLARGHAKDDPQLDLGRVARGEDRLGIA